MCKCMLRGAARGCLFQRAAWRRWLVLSLIFTCIWAQELKPTRWPLLSQKPVLLAWNSPTEDCAPRHRIQFNLEQFEIVASPNEGFKNQKLTIFYHDRLGLYPYYTKDGAPINGGLPQVASLTEHLERMPGGVKKYIRDPKAKGLAVIDWEEWRPLWIRNWEAKDIYRNRSRQLTAQKNPSWSKDKVQKMAQQEFEVWARNFMLDTLRLAKTLRPEQLWGYYLFPDCYNHDYTNSLENYTGRCPDVEMTRNDHLGWLWKESTALFPSIYMSKVLRSSRSGLQFVRNRVKEGMRLASSGDGLARPVFVYTRPTYTSMLETLTEMDLVSTIGESVALGAAGLIFWGDASYASSNASCSSLSSYLHGLLGRYLLNVTTAAEHCSRLRCNFCGRCLRKRSDADVYLHLSSVSHQLVSEGGHLSVLGQPSVEEMSLYRTEFRCQCYSGYTEESCALRDPLERRGASPSFQSSLFYLLCAMLLHALLH